MNISPLPCLASDLNGGLTPEIGGEHLIYSQQPKEVTWYIAKNNSYGVFGSHMQKQYGLNDFHSNHLISPSYLHNISGCSTLRTLLREKKKVASICMTKEFYHTVTIMVWLYFSQGINWTRYLWRYSVWHEVSFLPIYLALWFSVIAPLNYFTPWPFQKRNT